MKILNKLSVKHFCLVLMTLSLASFSLHAQTTLTVDHGATTVDGSIYNTLAGALDYVDENSGTYTIELAENGESYTIDANDWSRYGQKIRNFEGDITINGNNNTITWNISSQADERYYPEDWNNPINLTGTLSLNKCVLDFTGIYFSYFLSPAITVAYGGDLSMDSCTVTGLTDPSTGLTNPLIYSEGIANLSYCNFDQIDSYEDDIEALATGSPISVTINPICLLSDLSDPKHYIYKNSTNVIPGAPADDVEVLIQAGTSPVIEHTVVLPSCNVASIIAGNYVTILIEDGQTVNTDIMSVAGYNNLIIEGTLNITADLTATEDVEITNTGTLTCTDLNLDNITLLEVGNIEASGMLTLPENYELSVPTGASVTAGNLDILDGTRIVNEGTIGVTSTVHVYGDAFVQTDAAFGNTTTTVDLAFTPNAYRYFTPPFDINTDAIDGIKLETDVNSEDVQEGTSIWLWAYDESKRSADKINGWVLNTEEDMDLVTGRGYSIWSTTDQITFTADVQYPNLNGLEICNEIMFTDGGDLKDTGYNFLGNMYSLPLNLPVYSANKITAYYKCNEAGEYTCLSGKVGGITAGSDENFDLDLVSNMTIGSYGVFFAKATEATCETFDISNLALTGDSVRIKSEEVEEVEEPAEYLRVAISNDNSYDDFVILFEDYAEFDFDDYDADKIYPTSAVIESTRTLMSVGDTNDDEDYVIQGLPALEYLTVNEEISLPLHIRPLTSGDYTISVTLTEIEEQEMSVALYDNVTDVTTPLSSTETATISLTASETKSSPDQDDVDDRYSLVITPKEGIATEIETEEASEMTILSNDNFISVNAGSLIGKTVTLYDVSGRLMYENTFTSTIDISTVDFTPGFYVVVASDVNGQLYKEKVMIR